MYDRIFDAEWDELSREEAVRRAFALGVAEGVGNRRVAELERVKEAFPSAYDRSLVELAYDEGRTKAREAVDDADDAEEVWNMLVDGTGAPREPPVRTALPGAITDLTLTEPPREGPPSSLDFPAMLRK
jgi:hypothetical protein